MKAQNHIMSFMMVFVVLLLSGTEEVLGKTAATMGVRTVQKRCPACPRVMMDGWKYCPYDGKKLVDVKAAPKKTKGTEPKDVLYRFLEAVSREDTRMIREAMDVRGIVGNVLKQGISKLKIQKKRRDYLIREFVPKAAKQLEVLVLEMIVSPEMKETIQRYSFSKAKFELLFEQEITGNTARVFASDWKITEEVFFKREKGGPWRITRFPDLF